MVQPSTFAYFTHPQQPGDWAAWFPLLGRFPFHRAQGLFRWLPPRISARFDPIVSHCSRTKGWLVNLPFSNEQLGRVSREIIWNKLLAAGREVGSLGVKVIGLGGGLGALNDSAKALSKHLDIVVTNGNTYTVSTALEATLAILNAAKIDLGKAHIAVFGADSPMGSCAAFWLARSSLGMRYLTITGVRRVALQNLSQRIMAETGLLAAVDPTPARLAASADVVFNFAGVSQNVDINLFRSGTIVCDPLLPYRLARQLHRQRGDVTVLTGGLTSLPYGKMTWQPLPHNRRAEAAGITLLPPALAETILLTLAHGGNYRHSWVGTPWQRLQALGALARHHGLRTTAPRPVHYADLTEGGDV